MASSRGDRCNRCIRWLLLLCAQEHHQTMGLFSFHLPSNSSLGRKLSKRITADLDYKISLGTDFYWLKTPTFLPFWVKQPSIYQPFFSQLGTWFLFQIKTPIRTSAWRFTIAFIFNCCRLLSDEFWNTRMQRHLYGEYEDFFSQRHKKLLRHNYIAASQP